MSSSIGLGNFVYGFRFRPFFALFFSILHIIKDNPSIYQKFELFPQMNFDAQGKKISMRKGKN